MADFISEQSKFILDKFQIRKSKNQKEEFRTWLCQVLEAEGYRPAVEEARGLITSHNVVVGDPGKASVILGAHYDTCASMPFPNFITPRNFAVYLIYQLLLTAVIFVVAAIPAAVAAWLGAGGQAIALIWYAALLFCLWWMMAGKANKHTVNDNTSGVLTLLETALALPEEQRGKACFVFFDNEENGLLGSSFFRKLHKILSTHLKLFPKIKLYIKSFKVTLIINHITIIMNNIFKLCMRNFIFFFTFWTKFSHKTLCKNTNK